MLLLAITLSLFPPFNSGQYAGSVGGPYNDLGRRFMTTKQLMANCRSTTDRNTFALETLAGELGEEAFDRVEPGC